MTDILGNRSQAARALRQELGRDHLKTSCTLSSKDTSTSESNQPLQTTTKSRETTAGNLKITSRLCKAIINIAGKRIRGILGVVILFQEIANSNVGTGLSEDINSQ